MSINIGVAAHITAASPEGPRFDGSKTPEERKAADNGIWLCQNCATLIDRDTTRFTVALLHKWKSQAEESARRAVEANPSYSQGKKTSTEGKTDTKQTGSAIWIRLTERHVRLLKFISEAGLFETELRETSTADQEETSDALCEKLGLESQKVLLELLNNLEGVGCLTRRFQVDSCDSALFAVVWRITSEGKRIAEKLPRRHEAHGDAL